MGEWEEVRKDKSWELEVELKIREFFGDDDNDRRSDLQWVMKAALRYIGVPPNKLEDFIRRAYRRRLNVLSKELGIEPEYLKAKIAKIYPELKPYLF